MHFSLESEADKEYICSMPNDSGMHKCSDLPPFAVDGVECAASIETGLQNDTDCINWNQAR
jgi:hypothetical protein